MRDSPRRTGSDLLTFVREHPGGGHDTFATVATPASAPAADARVASPAGGGYHLA